MYLHDPNTMAQEDVFIKIGKSAVFNVLDGYNSTVFAYGQTGSGKTFTVTGGAERCMLTCGVESNAYIPHKLSSSDENHRFVQPQ